MSAIGSDAIIALALTRFLLPPRGGSSSPAIQAASLVGPAGLAKTANALVAFNMIDAFLTAHDRYYSPEASLFQIYQCLPKIGGLAVQKSPQALARGTLLAVA